MASTKLLFYKHKTYKDGTHPVIIQVLVTGRPPKRKVIASVKENQWDKKNKLVKNHPNMYQLNERITSEFNRVQSAVLKDGNAVDIDSLFPTEAKEVKPVSAKITFWQIADDYLDKISKQSGESWLTVKYIVNKFKDCIKNDNLLLSEISEEHIAAYNSYLNDRKNSNATKNLNWRFLRKIAKHGSIENKFDTKPEALFNFKLPPKKSHIIKTKLNTTELEAMKTSPIIAKASYREALDTFLLAIYLRGVRMSDMILLKQSQIKNGRYVYRSGKNKKNFDIKLIPPAIEIVNRYMDGREYLFHWYKGKIDRDDCTAEERLGLTNKIRNIGLTLNRRLDRIAKEAGIDKHVRSHIARHTFAKMIADKLPDRRVTMQLMGHGDLKTHETYIMEVLSTDELDEAVDGIF